MAKFLEVREASVSFSGKPALSNVSLAVGGAHPAITAVVGESGSGKTTLIRMLLGFQTPTTGTVIYDGQPLPKMSGAAQKLFRREVQAIFQDPFDAFNPFYKIDHPLLAPLKTFGISASRDESYDRIEKTLRSVGLNPAQTLGKYPHQISGGQRQRVMIARALLLEPEIILADEPVSMVDASLRSTILEILYELNRSRGISLIYVTHDLTTAYQVAHSIVVLHGGQIMEVGATEQVIHDPAHLYTRSLIEAVPSPDPDTPWNLDVATQPFAPPKGQVLLYPTGPERAVAAPVRPGEAAVTAAQVQLAVSQAKADALAS
ncbi:ABC transporter ATP-binding protein [Devosia sp. 2618]|uniref:ABC transporter ATP-binding protein n=1 Tax=Devosia sp. 2618 TaxID=3156454 RepID=UPI003390C6BF